MKTNKYSWLPDIPDHRDYTLNIEAKASLPNKVDLRNKDVPIFDQQALGSCTANAISAAYAFDLNKQNEKLFIPSRLFIYYNERLIEGTVGQDSGAMIRDGIKAISISGVCSENNWIYDIAKFKKKPYKRCYREAANNKAVLYQRVNRTLIDMKNCLASNLPFVIGFSVYESFESNAVANNGIMPMPQKNEKLLGGHAVLVMGYDDSSNHFIVRNSWGNSWGDNGYFYMPYEYLLNQNLSDDFWTIQKVS